MQRFEFEALRRIGLTLAAAQQFLTLLEQHPGALPVRVVEVHRETLRLDSGTQALEARRLPGLARALADREDAVAVGDWGLARVDEHGQWWFTHCLEPFGALSRRDGDGVRHIVASNVDTALIVCGLDQDFSPRRIERFLALVQGSRVEPVLVLSKPDLCADLEHAMARLRDRLPPSLPRFALDGRLRSSAAPLEPWLGHGRTLVLLGSSGAGKSTLLNTLAGDDVQATGATRDGDGRGRHTTTSRSLHRLPGGACVIDTPGVRTLRPDADATTLAASFDDVARLAPACRFRNCRHQGEPGCAVEQGVEPDRLNNFHKLQREMRRDTMNALERKRLLGEWKARCRAGMANLRAKRGE